MKHMSIRDRNGILLFATTRRVSFHQVINNVFDNTVAHRRPANDINPVRTNGGISSPIDFYP